MSKNQQGYENARPPMSRRGFFDRIGSGTYGAALAYLLGKDLSGSASPPKPGEHSFDVKARAPHFQPKAKAVIHLVMQGGPSHIDLFDPKPKLKKLQGQQPSRETIAKTDLDTDRIGGLLPTPLRFVPPGRSPLWRC